MLGGIEPPCVRAKAEELDHLLRHPLLALDGEVSDQERVVHFGVTELGDQRYELGLELVEDLAHFGGARVRLEVVEQDVVRLVDSLVALDVAPPQLDVSFQCGQEELEVRLGLGLDPHRDEPARLHAPSRHAGPWEHAQPSRSRAVPAGSGLRHPSPGRGIPRADAARRAGGRSRLRSAARARSVAASRGDRPDGRIRPEASSSAGPN